MRLMIVTVNSNDCSNSQQDTRRLHTLVTFPPAHHDHLHQRSLCICNRIKAI